MRNHGPRARCARLPWRRPIEVDLDRGARAAAKFLQDRHQIHFIIWCIQAKTGLGNQVVAVDQIRHPPILTATASCDRARRAGLRGLANAPPGTSGAQFIEVVISKRGGFSRCFLTAHSSAE